MKSKNFTSLLLLMFVVVLPMLNGCKKGEEDPFFSIHTRKARVTGVWDINYFKSDIKTIYGEGTNQIRTVTEISGTNWKETVYILGSDESEETKGKILNFKIKFDNNGLMNYIFEYQVVERVVDEDLGRDTTITTTIKKEFSGTWNFLAGIDEYNNKERLALVIQEEKFLKIVSKYTIDPDDDEAVGVTFTQREAYTRRYANGEMSTIWILRMLKNKEIIMDQNINDLIVTTDVFGNGNSISEVGLKTQTLVRE